MYLSAHRELRASPRKPNVATVLRSEKSRSLEVWCFSVSDSKFSGATPLPLSATSTSSEPCSFSLTSCVCVCGGGAQKLTIVKLFHHISENVVITDI